MIQRFVNKVGEDAKTENQPSPASPITVVLPEASSSISLQTEVRFVTASVKKGQISCLSAKEENID